MNSDLVKAASRCASDTVVILRTSEERGALPAGREVTVEMLEAEAVVQQCEACWRCVCGVFGRTVGSRASRRVARRRREMK